MKAVPEARELLPRVFWLGGCLAVLYQGEVLHGYNSVYLVAGDDCSLLVEGGHPQDLPIVEAQLERLLADGLPPLRYMFVTHTETPHSAAIGRILSHYPTVMAYGGMLDVPLVFPEFADRMRPFDPGDALDLGGTQFRAVEAVIRDMPYSRWGFDTKRRVLFPGDGFAYSHYHKDGHCGMLAEEASSLDIPDMTALFADIALYWTRFVDMEPYLDRLDEMLDELDVKFIAPTHGLPISDLAATYPRVREGLLLGSSRTESKIVF
jgi:flavorubredoxin